MTRIEHVTAWRWYDGLHREGDWQPVSVPKHYRFLPAGNTALTKAIKRQTSVIVVREKVRGYTRTKGIYAPAQIIDEEVVRHAARRGEFAAERHQRQERDIARFTARIREDYPQCPEGTIEAIAEHTCEIGSRRVGRSRTADNPVKAAVIAYIRHNHTDYDGLLSSGYERDEAREMVIDQIFEILDRWEGNSPSQVFN